MLRRLIAVLLLAAPIVGAQSRFDRWALVLEDPPAVEQAAKAAGPARRAAAAEGLTRIRAVQQRLTGMLRERGVTVLGANQYILNAVYVRATREQAQKLAALPGVARVVRMMPVKLAMDRALDIVRAQQAWSQVGGFDNAGAGVKIGILDTGIDHTHPAFQDSSLQPPPGFPKGETDYTNNKIIVARSYVDMLVWADRPDLSRPDDTTPRDRVGHGTAVAMVAAGVRTTGPAATVSGVAPKAFLGNYKIFGSPGVNDVTFDDVIAQALEDAVLDGMDIAVLPVGRGAEWAPGDRGGACQKPGQEACDLRTQAVENAVASGLTVVVPAGNDGDLSGTGSKYPALNSINTPGTAPSAITVGATTNSHIFFNSVKVTGGGVPANLQSIPALFGDGARPPGPLTAPLKDVAQTEPPANAKACSPVGAGTLTGAIAIVDRGDCAFATKVNNIQKGGAVGVIVVRTDSDVIFPMTGLVDTGIPAVMIGKTDGANLRNFLAQNPGRQATLDPKLEPRDAFADDIAYFSSRGPSIGGSLVKPEVVAVGTDLYMATQDYDPNSDMWDASRYTAAQGTSFATPMVAGAAALVLQQHPDFNPAQVKSAVVNTATPRSQLADFDENGTQVPVSVTAAGAGRLNAENAAKARITVTPATISLGVVTDSLPVQALTITNHGNDAVALTLNVEPADPRLTLSATALNLGPGASAQVTVTLTEVPPPGRYEGDVVITGGPVPLRVPFLYLRSDGVPYNLIPLSGVDFVGNVGEWVDGRDFNLNVKVVDRYGAPVPDVPVLFRATIGGGAIEEATGTTDRLGIAAATATIGPTPGEQEFSVEIDGQPETRIFFRGRAKLRPAINTNGIVNAADGSLGDGLAPGSYISIYGSNLSDALRVFNTPYLPLSLAGVSVSFDRVDGRGSYPGRLHFVSENQINVQIPWEVQGRTSVWVKVSTGPLTESALYKLPLSNYSPAFFEIPDLGGTGRQLVAALDEGFKVVSSTNPVRRGHVVQLFANGLGPVTNTPPSGEVSPANPLSETTERPTVTIGGWDASVQFSGLAPGNVGLYQVNVVVPDGLSPGLYDVVLTIGGVETKPVLLYVGE